MSPLSQPELHERFRVLHERGFVMPNAWDGLSALVVRDAGFAATATSSAALAFSLGRVDGDHQVGRDEHLAHARLLGEASGLPVNGDLEDGYGEDPDEVAATVVAAIESGLAGLGIEDTSADPAQPIRDFDEAVARVRAAAGVARGRIVLTGRTDNFLQGRPDLDDTIRRLAAFAEVGADVLYAPGLPDMASIQAIVAAVAPKPVNVVLGPADGHPSADALLAAGVRRISLGGALYRYVMGALQRVTAAVASGELAALGGGMPFAEASRLLGGSPD